MCTQELVLEGEVILLHLKYFYLEPVWPVKNCQMSIKVAQNDFTGNMKDFNNFAKIH